MQTQPQIRARSATRVIVIEDERDLRNGLQVLLNMSPDFECVKSFASMEEALRTVDSIGFDLVVTDIRLPS